MGDGAAMPGTHAQSASSAYASAPAAFHVPTYFGGFKMLENHAHSPCHVTDSSSNARSGTTSLRHLHGAAFQSHVQRLPGSSEPHPAQQALHFSSSLYPLLRLPPARQRPGTLHSSSPHALPVVQQGSVILHRGFAKTTTAVMEPDKLARARKIAVGVGMFAGAFGSLVGIGGGVLIAPIIINACRTIPQRVVSGTSLAAVATTGDDVP